MNLITNRIFIGVAIIVFSLSLGLGFFIYNKGKEVKAQEVVIKQQETYIDTRKRIDAVSRHNTSVDDATKRLLERQSKRNK
jgi:hypothetical protein